MKLSEWFALLAPALGAAALMFQPAPAHAVACGQPPTGDSAGSVTVEQFIEKVTAAHADLERIELATFGLG